MNELRLLIKSSMFQSLVDTYQHYKANKDKSLKINQHGLHAKVIKSPKSENTLKAAASKFLKIPVNGEKERGVHKEKKKVNNT
jgi:hypothetical protein